MRPARQRYHDKLTARDKANGNPHRVPTKEALEIRSKLRSLGMTDTRMAEQATENGFFIHQTTISALGQRGNVCSHLTLAAMRSLRPEEVTTKLVNGVGAVRLLQGLVYAGYSQNWLAGNVVYEQVSSRFAHVYANAIIRNRHKYVALGTFKRIQGWAAKLEFVPPESMGIKQNVITRSKSHARVRNWAPLKCWDDDTVLDPEAVPQWTGKCGTVAGLRIHMDQRDMFHWRNVDGKLTDRMVIGCEPCREAQKAARSGNQV